MGRYTLSDTAYRRVADEASSAGSATFRGEQRKREGLGLHPLVDPAGYEVIRRSLTWYEPKGDHFVLLRGVAMLEETRLDSTGSMGTNVNIAMKVLPTTYKLLATGKNPVLGRYDVQMITSIFGDVVDNYVLCRSQAEMDERIAEQMTLMLPEGGGGDSDEDPQYGIFGGAYLTQNSANGYGLKSYDFTVTDARGRDHLDKETLVRVYGPTVFDRVRENGFQVNPSRLPSVREVVRDLQKRAHAFVILVNPDPHVSSFWSHLYGKGFVVESPRTEWLPQIKAAIIGLTEGVLDLQSVEDYLRDAEVVEGAEFRMSRGNSRFTKADARLIRDSVAHIPVGAQAALPNFDKLPLKGAKFAKKGDLWPMGEGPKSKPAAGKKPSAGGKDGMWL